MSKRILKKKYKEAIKNSSREMDLEISKRESKKEEREKVAVNDLISTIDEEDFKKDLIESNKILKMDAYSFARNLITKGNEMHKRITSLEESEGKNTKREDLFVLIFASISFAVSISIFRNDDFIARTIVGLDVLIVAFAQYRKHFKSK